MELRTEGPERGATLIFVSITLVLLMGFAAIAVDYGSGVVERRLDQNTADTSVLSAGVELIVSGNVQEAVGSVKEFVDTNLARTLTAADWESCVDSEALAFPSNTIPGVTGGSNCISFGPNDDGVAFAKIRVRIPNQTANTYFARVLGFDGLETFAIAEAQLTGSGGVSGSFPAAVFSGAQQGDTFCIKTGTPSNPASGQSCGSPSTGDFGNFQPYFYTEISPGNPNTLCTSGNQPAPLARAIADGIDHFLGTTPSAPGNRTNGANCPQFPGPLFPNRVDSGSGYSNSDITDGLVLGGSYDGNYTGRLTRQNWGAAYGTATVFQRTLDNRPLWTYIDSSVLNTALHTACVAAAAGPNSHSNSNDAAAEAVYQEAQQNMLDCLSSSPPDSLFVDDLYESQRLTIVPMYHQSAPLGNNACCYDIKTFVPVFIEGIWTNEGTQWTCDGGMTRDTAGGYCKHEPGRTGTIHINAQGNRRVDSANAIVLSCDVLPGVEGSAQKCSRVGSGGNTADIFLDLFLTR